MSFVNAPAGAWSPGNVPRREAKTTTFPSLEVLQSLCEGQSVGTGTRRRRVPVPTDCLVFEDVSEGAEAACNAGVAAVVLTTTHEPAEFSCLLNVRHCAPDFTGAFMRELVK